MKRRNILIGMGGIAGAGAAIGTGAFDQVNADRAVSVNVEGDADAYLGLEPINSAYATTDGDGVLELTFDEDGGAGGDGFNPNSTTRIDGVFSISNQGTQDVGVSVEKGGLAEGVKKFDFLAQTDTDEESLVHESPVVLESGESFDVGVEAEISSSDTIDGVIDDDEIVITADIDDEDGADELQPVQNVSTGVSYPTISAAISAAEPSETVQVGAGSYEESVTIDTEGLTLEAADGASPTVDGQGEIPVLVDDADDVTVDDENINFESGIDVGADFSDYDPGIDESDADAIVTSDATEDDEYESIGAALDEEGADTTVLVKPDYDDSNEDSDNAGSSSALISIVHENVEVISEHGPEETQIPTNKDRIVDIQAEDVVFKGFDIQDASAEGIFVRSLEERASGIKITDNKVAARESGIALGGGFATRVGTNGAVIENNLIEIDSGIAGISLSDDTNPEVERNTIRDTDDDAGDGIFTSGSDGDVEDAVISGNLIEDTRYGLVSGIDNAPDISEATNNHLINNTFDVVATSGAEINASNNWFGTENKTDLEEGLASDDSSLVTLDQWAGAPINPDAGDEGDE